MVPGCRGGVPRFSFPPHNQITGKSANTRERRGRSCSFKGTADALLCRRPRSWWWKRGGFKAPFVKIWLSWSPRRGLPGAWRNRAQQWGLQEKPARTDDPYCPVWVNKSPALTNTASRHSRGQFLSRINKLINRWFFTMVSKIRKLPVQPPEDQINSLLGFAFLNSICFFYLHFFLMIYWILVEASLISL